MQILTLLKKDHDEVKDLLARIEKASRAKKVALFEKLKTDLLAHAHAEQDVFYTALEEHEEALDLALEAEVEHEVVERLIEEIDAIDIETQEGRWTASVTVLGELIEHHVK
jgi:hemerythrin superfamily protein